jgi:hypothetical protein
VLRNLAPVYMKDHLHGYVAQNWTSYLDTVATVLVLITNHLKSMKNAGSLSRIDAQFGDAP